MIYVCSDVHGHAERFYKMLDEIQLAETDTLYILGDIIDRNPDGIELLKYVMGKDNIILLMGNHEDFMYSYLVNLNILGKLDEKENFPNNIWLSDNNGGKVTLEKFAKESLPSKKEILTFLSTLPLIVLLEVNGTKFHLSHAGTIPQVLGKDVWYVSDVNKYEREYVTWYCPYRYDCYISKCDYPVDYVSIIGHVPVERINYDGGFSFIRDDNIINIDSGCSMYSLENTAGIKTALSCLRLDDMKAFYVH